MRPWVDPCNGSLKDLTDITVGHQQDELSGVGLVDREDERARGGGRGVQVQIARTR